MKIYKNKTVEQLNHEDWVVNDWTIGKYIITKSLVEGFPFEVSVYDGTTPSEYNGNINKDPLVFKSIGLFPNLNSATKMVMRSQDDVNNYEYYCQIHRSLEEGGDSVNASLQTMGQLGWELCSIFGSQFIYKRVSVN